MKGEDEHELIRMEQMVQAELIMAQVSHPDRPADATDAELPFNAAAVQAYEIRLIALRDAAIAVESYESRNL